MPTIINKARLKDCGFYWRTNQYKPNHWQHAKYRITLITAPGNRFHDAINKAYVYCMEDVYNLIKHVRSPSKFKYAPIGDLINKDEDGLITRGFLQSLNFSLTNSMRDCVYYRHDNYTIQIAEAVKGERWYDRTNAKFIKTKKQLIDLMDKSKKSGFHGEHVDRASIQTGTPPQPTLETILNIKIIPANLKNLKELTHEMYSGHDDCIVHICSESVLLIRNGNIIGTGGFQIIKGRIIGLPKGNIPQRITHIIKFEELKKVKFDESITVQEVLRTQENPLKDIFMNVTDGIL